MESLLKFPQPKKLKTPQITSAIEDNKYMAHDFPSLTLNRRQLCDLELILNGGFAPLDGFMKQADYENVLQNMRLSNGTLWPIPITLDVDHQFAQRIKTGDEIALRDEEGLPDWQFYK